MNKNKSALKHRLGVNANNRKNNSQNKTSTIKNVTDARLKLIAKKRQEFKDARERLGQIARQTDARLKLNKNKKSTNAQSKVQQNKQNVHLGRKFTSGNKIVVQNSFARQPSFAKQSNLARQPSFAKQSNLARQPSFAKQSNFARQPSFAKQSNFARQPAMQTARQPANNTVRPQNQPFRRPIKSLMDINTNNQSRKSANRNNGIQKRNAELIKTSAGTNIQRTIKAKVRSSSTVVRKKQVPSVTSISHRYYPLSKNPNVVTIKNKTPISSKPSRSPAYASSANKSSQNVNRRSSNSTPTSNKWRQDPPRFKINKALMTNPAVLSSQLMERGDRNSNVWFPGKPSGLDQNPNKNFKITTQNNYMQRNGSPWNHFSQPQQNSMERSSDVMSRLDENMDRSSRSGFKLLVSNLHQVVTPEDVKELFQTIGPLRYSRMLASGVAEVIFIHEGDAHRAIEVYNNRQLDGQPMNVRIDADDNFRSAQGRGGRMDAEDNFRSAQGRGGRIDHENNFRSPQGRGGSFNRPQNPQFMGVDNIAGSGLRYSGNSMRDVSFSSGMNTNVAPDLGAIHHALFNQRPMQNMRPNPPSFSSYSMRMGRNY